jgi:hypothetical protein
LQKCSAEPFRAYSSLEQVLTVLWQEGANTLNDLVGASIRSASHMFTSLCAPRRVLPNTNLNPHDRLCYLSVGPGWLLHGSTPVPLSQVHPGHALLSNRVLASAWPSPHISAPPPVFLECVCNSVNYRQAQKLGLRKKWRRWIWLMDFLFKNEYRILKSVEITVRRGLMQKGEK